MGNQKLEDLIKSVEPALKSIKNPVNNSSSLWDAFSDDISEENSDLILEPLDDLKPLELDLWDETPAPPPTATEPPAEQPLEQPAANDVLVEPVSLALEEQQAAPEEPLSEEVDSTDEDLEALLNSFDQPGITEAKPSTTEDEVEASEEEISSFLASFEEPDHPEIPTSPELQDSRIHPEIVEFDDDNLEQQIDDMLDDMVLNVTAVKTPTQSSSTKPGANSIIVDDDIEIEFEFDVANQEPPQQKQPSQPEAIKKDASKLRRYGGLLSDFDSIEEETENIALTKKGETSKSDPLLTLLEQVGKNSGEAVEQRLTHILSAAGDSQEIKELCALVAQAYGINSQFLSEPKADQENSTALETDPLSPLKNELEHEIDLLLSKGSSISTTAVPQVPLDTKPLPPSVITKPEPEENQDDDIEKLLKELGDDDSVEFEIDLETEPAQKKNTEPVIPPAADLQISNIREISDLPTADPTASLWANLEQEIASSTIASDLDIEIDINEVIQFKPNNTTTLLFDLLEEEILNPTKAKEKPTLNAIKKNTCVENHSLVEAFKQYDHEVKVIAKLKAEGKYIDPKKRVILPTYRPPALWRRICAGLLDLTLYVTLAITISIVFFIPWDVKTKLLNISDLQPEYLVPQIAAILGTIFVSWLVIGITLVLSQSKSFGQKLLKLELQNPESPTISFSQALIYITAQIFSFLLFFLGYLGALGKSHKTLHDHLSGLVVSSSTANGYKKPSLMN